VLPPLVLGTRLPRQRGVLGFLLYFLFIGAGYILIEVGLIQKFVLFLGHPTYALTVVIFSMLVSSGVGSGLSRRVLGKDEGRLIKVLGSVALLAALLALVASWTAGGAGVAPDGVESGVITVVLIAPLGLVMGMPFPTGLGGWRSGTRLRCAGPGLECGASVLGSVGALVCSIYLGLIQTLIIGGLFYLGPWRWPVTGSESAYSSSFSPFR
jgi:hypothetical protein